MGGDFGLADASGLVFPCVAAGLVWGFYNWRLVDGVPLRGGFKEANADSESPNQKLNTSAGSEEKMDKVAEISGIVKEGAKAFLNEEYQYCGLFCLLFAVLIYGAVDEFTRFYTTAAFLIGVITSIGAGYVCMMIACSSNSKTAAGCISGLKDGFRVAFRAGCSMGFLLVSMALGVLMLLIIIEFNIKCEDKTCGNGDDLAKLFDYIAGFGLGGSTVALFGRVGGGIYTKAADVGADLVGKVVHELDEDSPRNPATIADNVGDNVGDVAGMGADLFGSFAESTCAALVVSAAQLTTSESGPNIEFLFFPIAISAVGIIASIVTSIHAGFIKEVNHPNEIESTLKQQLLFSSIILTPTILGIAYWTLPEKFYIGTTDEKGAWEAWIVVSVGLWAGLAIGYFTEYMTSHSYKPVRDVANSCTEGAAINIIYGLALGYLSTIVPIIAIAITAFVSIKLLGFYGVALGALGMLSNLPISLAIDGYGPISDNAGGIAEMSELGPEIRERTDALDAAGNTTAAIGKGFAIGSAALVGLSLYGGFITRATTWTLENVTDKDQFKHGLTSASLTDPTVFSFLLIGAMLPYCFSAFTMKSVGMAAKDMVKEVERQIKERPGMLEGKQAPDYAACISISTKASLREMVPPAILVIVTPILCGIFFGPLAIAGLLPGSLVSGVQLAISAANTGGAWDNAKKYIEGGNLVSAQGVAYKKKSDPHKAAVIGDTVGDPLKDTSGPSLNILIKLMAILSLVFAEFFCVTGWLVGPLNIGSDIGGEL